MRERRGTNCLSRWRGINAFIRHPRTGRGVTLRRAQDAIEFNGDYEVLWRAEELGAFLRGRREGIGILLERVSERTRIAPHLLDAIERGRFELLPGGLFTRSFVRIYARALGVTDDELKGFLLRTGQGAVAKAAPSAGEVAREEHAPGKVRPPRLSEFLLYLFLTKSERVNLLGDTDEEYREVFEKFGRRAANAWFRKQVFDSLRPLIRRSISKVWILIVLAQSSDRIAEIIRRVVEHLLRGDK
jgi:transcriptional regulator with XRE-family HTH domain